MGQSIPITLLRENFKKITLTSHHGVDSVGLIVWSKKGTPQLVLDLSVGEAKALRALLNVAITVAE